MTPTSTTSRTPHRDPGAGGRVRPGRRVARGRRPAAGAVDDRRAPGHRGRGGALPDHAIIPPPVPTGGAHAAGSDLTAGPRPKPRRTPLAGSMLVAAGILLSRCARLIREVVIGGAGREPGRRRQGGAAHPQPDAEPAGRVLSASSFPCTPGCGRRPPRRGRPAGRRHRRPADRSHRAVSLSASCSPPAAKLLVPGYTAGTYEPHRRADPSCSPASRSSCCRPGAWGCSATASSSCPTWRQVLWNAAQIVALVVGVLVVGGYSERPRRPGGGAGLGCWSAACCSSGSRSGRCAGCWERSGSAWTRARGGSTCRPVRPGAAGPGRHPDHGVGRPVAGSYLAGGGVVADLHDGAVPAAGRPVRGERGGRRAAGPVPGRGAPRDPRASGSGSRTAWPASPGTWPPPRCSSWWAT